MLKKYCNNNNRAILFSLLIIIIASITSNYWVLSKHNYFVFDDYAWLYQSHFTSFGELINILPNMAYNDRPVGAVFLKILYLMFGLNNQAHHFVLLMLHVFNGLLLYFVIRFAMKKIVLSNSKINSIALITALLFSVWPKSVMSLQWDAAIFDLLGMTLTLLVLFVYFYSKRIEHRRYVVFDTILMVILFYMALRTKEMFILIPFILMIYEITINYYNKSKLLAINVQLKSMGSVSIGYLVLLFILRQGNNIVVESSSPYYQEFNPITVLVNLVKYIFLYFNLTGSEFAFFEFKFTGILLLIVFGLGLLYSILLQFNKKPWIFIIYVCIVLSLAPVLPMKNFQHNLYLYFPSMFISLLIAILISFIIHRIIKRDVILIITHVIITICLVLAISLNQSVQENRNYWKTVGGDNRTSLYDLWSIEAPSGDVTIYIQNANNGHHIFYYGPGFVNNIIFDNREIVTVINPSEIDKSKPYVLLEYMDGRIHVLERNDLE